MIALLLVSVALVVFALCFVALYRATPILCEDWRIITAANANRWRYDQDNTIVVMLVKRLHRAQQRYQTSGNEHRIPVGEARIDDPDFDERLVELKFRADDIRARIRAIR